MVSPDESIFIPIEFLKKATHKSEYNVLVVKASEADSVDEVTETLRSIYSGRAQVFSVQQISRIITQITSQFNVLLVSIASTSFIAAGLGTFNIMMISVLERVREIGVLKALGMKDEQVLTLYVSQGVLVGLMGSLIGVAGGMAIAYALPAFTISRGMDEGFTMPNYSPVISPTYILLSVALSIIVTFLSTMYPAWKASRLRPVEALRYE
ncbi:MAG: FtsX-like permease family protein [Candidatus Bathyarchaeia archaeon]